MSERRYFEHYAVGEPALLERWYCCLCCAYPTLGCPNDYEICPLCDWFDDYVDGWPQGTPLEEARENFRAYFAMYRPGSNGFRLSDSESERSAKRELMAAYDAYMAEPDLHRRGPLFSKARRLSDNLPFGDSASGS